MAIQQAKPIKPLSCRLGIHEYRGSFIAYAHGAGEDKEFPLQYWYCLFCSKKKFAEK